MTKLEDCVHIKSLFTNQSARSYSCFCFIRVLYLFKLNSRHIPMSLQEEERMDVRSISKKVWLTTFGFLFEKTKYKTSKYCPWIASGASWHRELLAELKILSQEYKNTKRVKIIPCYIFGQYEEKEEQRAMWCYINMMVIIKMSLADWPNTCLLIHGCCLGLIPASDE